MKTNVHARRWVAGLALAALMVTMAAPAAEARSKKHRDRGSHHTRVVKRVKYKTSHRHAPRPYRTVVHHVHRSSDVPVFAGFIGGLVLGAVLTNAAQADVVRDYDYYDPYCNRHFESLAVYRTHFPGHHHPRVVRVIEVRSGDCVETLRWHEGDWRHHDWDDGVWYDD